MLLIGSYNRWQKIGRYGMKAKIKNCTNEIVVRSEQRGKDFNLEHCAEYVIPIWGNMIPTVLEKGTGVSPDDSIERHRDRVLQCRLYKWCLLEPLSDNLCNSSLTRIHFPRIPYHTARKCRLMRKKQRYLAVN